MLLNFMLKERSKGLKKAMLFPLLPVYKDKKQYLLFLKYAGIYEYRYVIHQRSVPKLPEKFFVKTTLEKAAGKPSDLLKVKVAKSFCLR